MIPKTIHFVWVGDRPMPDWAQRNIEEFERLNRGYSIIVNRETVLLPVLRPLYDACTRVEQQADLVRYSALSRCGGWYFDTDFWPFRPLDEAQRAWGLDGSCIAIARQHGHLSGDALPYANAPLCCGRGLGIWHALIDEAVRRTPNRRSAYGPDLMTWLVENHPGDVDVMDWPWWFPSSIADAPSDFAAIQSGDVAWARRMCPQTGGQLPFAMHLWAGGKQELKTEAVGRPRALIVADPSGPEFRHALPCERWPVGHPIPASRDGLTNAGFDVICATQASAPAPRFVRGGAPVQVAVVWNGQREPSASIVKSLRDAGVPVFHIEHGFWDRRRYVQCDAGGFLAWSAWARDWPSPTPDMQARFDATAGVEIHETRARGTGHVLVIGQVAGDTQLRDSALAGPAPLERLVSRALPEAVKAVFRPHPKATASDAVRIGAGRSSMPRLLGSLADALAGARFVVSINSNTAVECAMAGVPLLEFGPSLALNAGFSRRATVDTLAADLAAMMQGWAPPAGAGRRYLLNLAARQFHVDELRTADFWRRRISCPT